MWLAAGLTQAGNLLNDVAARALSLPDFVGTLAGIRTSKRLRLRVVVLRDEVGEPLLAESAVASCVERAADILLAGCKVRIEALRQEPMVITAPTPAPLAALEVNCNLTAWREDLGAAGTYFRSLTHGGVAGSPFGYGTPLTVLVVRRIGGWSGCSIGPLASYVTVTAAAVRSGDGRTLAHELGHACLLLHRRGTGNLMARSGGDALTRWQAAVVRSSAHVTFL